MVKGSLSGVKEMEFPSQGANRAAPSTSSPDVVEKRAFLVMLRSALRGPDESVSSKSDAAPAPSLQGLLKNAPALLAQASRNNSGRSVAPGEVWPTGTGEASLRNRFQQATPPELGDLAPHGMELPVESGFNIAPATSDAQHAAGDIRRMTLGGIGGLTTSLLNAYLSGRGENHELSARHMNKLFDNLNDPFASFMDEHVEKIRRVIRDQIAATGETSGKIRGVTDWTTTYDKDFRSSLGMFSGKLLYELEYSQEPDGWLRVSGSMALAVQDLYDFSERSLPNTIPAALLPRQFTERPGHVNERGSFTDTGLATMQQEGIASPFYVFGISGLRNIQMNLRPGHNNWELNR
jgi:hypothetical protein